MKYDLAIIGSGPAGLTASVYASRYGIPNVVIGTVAGGLASHAPDVGNWLGTKKISGFEFGQNALEHAKSLGAEMVVDLVDEIKKENGTFSLLLKNGNAIEAKAVLLATGTERKSLSIPGEKEFAGKGVSHCATCDGFFYKNKTVVVIGGGDSAAGAAIFLANIAEKVYLACREKSLSCETFWHKKIGENSKIEMLHGSNVLEIKGEQKVSSVVLDKPYKGSNEISVDGVFIEIGAMPNTKLAKDLGVELDEEGYIKIKTDGSTNVEGIWAAGDITNGSDKFKQIITAAAEGAVSVHSIKAYLKK
ncbi:MAG TPA: FAD-dependent oxidoreductase [Candidatus Moranbacteria bacterium]|jgi:thioredoxin reductase (NADPH)|nr:FAD-dependent oxidoreductase [Candidatus Moranbacteria bacterium]HOF42358.1 FAD-dependent oxidoreductase [Candidatus Moranbacteria bacterium]HPX94468.1 FAD-dependent oxidoreductase [Candidatus Moranbacteria bacterium]HQB59645.1 FAD-dependent oxidoreductase [Candidatus Moranbacteria bacterium]